MDTVDVDSATPAISPQPQRVETVGRSSRSWGWGPQIWKPALYGVLSAGGLLIFYLGVITIAQDAKHAFEQLGEDRWFVGAIALGFGLQVALFTLLRGLHKRARAGGVAASTGVSTGAMLACCAHHLADVLPVLGLSGAAVFLNEYKTPLLWLAIGMNLAGAAYLFYQVRRQLTSRRSVVGEATSCHVSTQSQAG